MPTLMPDQLDDFVENTLVKHFKTNWVDLSLQYPEYFFANFIKSSSGKMPNRGGHTLSHKIQTQNLGSFRRSEMYAQESAHAKDLFTKVEVPWTKVVTSFAYDVDEDEMQQGPEQIIDTVLGRAHAMWNDYFEGMEEEIWHLPASPSEAPRGYYGIPYWVVKDPTTTPTGAFNGGNPAGHTGGAGGLSSSVVTQWKNWTYGYTKVDRDDLIHKIRRACRWIKWTPPHKYPQLDKGGKMQYQLVTTESVVNDCEKLAETRNDNLGNDLIRYADQVTIKGAPLVWVPYLSDNDASDPIYHLNWSVLKHFYRKGKEMQVAKPRQAAHQPTVREVFGYAWQNMYCMNRRRLAVGSRA